MARKEDAQLTQGSIDLALQEDLGTVGDVTACCFSETATQGSAEIVCKQAGIISGVAIAATVFHKVEPKVTFSAHFADGAAVTPGDILAAITGPTRGILTAERTALNFLQRLSGVATLTSKYVKAVAGTQAKILDTRKTTPGLRLFEKAAVRAGGGYNHRFGLFDMVLIKENHIHAAGGLASAIQKVRQGLTARQLNLAIEVEARTLEEVEAALSMSVDRIMLDNMRPADMRTAVRMVAGKVELEASGGITLANVREIAETGVDYISVGALTHSAPALDLSLLLR